MFHKLLKIAVAYTFFITIAACSSGGNGGDGENGGSGSNGGSNSTASIELDDGDVLGGGGGSSIVSIPASDDTGIVRVNNSIVRQGRLPECSNRFADNSLVADSLIEACVSDQAGCEVTFQPVTGAIDVIPPPLYAPIGVEYQMALVDRDATVADPINAIFCFDVGVNLPPVFAPDTYQITFPSSISRSGVRYDDRCEKLEGSEGVLANDDDDEHVTNSCLQAVLVNAPQYASNRDTFASTFGSDGSFVYEAFQNAPPEDSNGARFDSFTYTVTDGINPPSEPITVEIVFTSENQAPLTADDNYEINEDAGFVVFAVLENDSDPDALPLTITRIANGPGNGVANIRNGTLIEYRPAAGFVGGDGFTYFVEDSGGLTASANVSVNILNVNDPPQARNDEVSTNENSSIVIQVVDNDSDPENNSLTVSSVSQPRNGTAAVASDRSVSYRPDANFSGRDSFEYTITDGAETATATVVVNVIDVNVGPIATADQFSVAAGESAEFDLLANDSDEDGNSLSIVSVSGAANGTAELLSTGIVRYTPNDGFSGSDDFTYLLSDGVLDATGRVDVNVFSVNAAPVANNDAASTPEDTAVSINVLDNDTDVDGDSLSVVSITGVASGSATIASNNQSITYTPEQSFSGQTDFSYTIDDGNGGTDTATVSVSVSSVNAAPVAVDDTRSTEENDAVRILVLENDSDPDGDSVTLDSTSQPANGAAALFGGNSIIYTPATDFSGTDTFTYTISDPDGVEAIGTVTVTVSDVNSGPVASDDSASTSENVDVLIAVTDNDSDPDGDALTVQLVDLPLSGTAVLQSGDVLYSPAVDFSGTDEFTYSVTDPGGVSDTATVTVTISDVNTVPVAEDDAAVTNEDVAVLIAVLDNDSDPDGDSLVVAIVSGPADGAAALQGSDILYTPDTGFAGDDEIVYSIADPSGATATAIVSITVSNVNAAPIAVDDTSSTETDDPVSIGILANDSDPDGDTLILAVSSQPANGTATLSNQGTRIVYSPELGFAGVDSFEYEITDGNGGADTATVTVTVTSINAPPVALDDVAQATEGQPVNFNILANDSDPDGDSLIVTMAVPPEHGNTTILPDFRINYISLDTHNGSDSFVYQVDDGNGGTDTATVDITITGFNTAPQAVDDVATTAHDTPVAISVLGNDTDSDGDVLAVSVTSTPANGLANIELNNDVTYTPNAGFSGVDSFDYTIDDGNGGTDSAEVEVVVAAALPVNNPPIALADTAETDEDIPVDIAVLLNDSDPDGDSLSISAITILPSSGTAVLNTDDSINYAPLAGFSGVDTFSYTIDDGNGGSAGTTVEVTVLAASVNNAPIAVADSVSTDEGVALDIVVLTNDSDPDGDPISVTAISVMPGNGVAVLNADESINYAPISGFTGTDTFEYTISDLAGVTATAIVEVIVQPVV